MLIQPLAGKTAVVTGSGRGIGAAIAADLARAGARVVVNYLNNTEAAQSVAHGIRDSGGECTVVRADVTTADGAAALIHAARNAYGAVDVLVSNAGPLFRPIPLMQMTWEEFGGIVEQDLRSAFFTTQATLPDMIDRGYGRIVYIGSMSATRSTPGLAHHGAARAALTAFSRYVAAEAAHHGVTVNVVAPGMVRTDRTSAAGRMLETMGAATPAGRVATPQDVARAVRYFVCDPDGFTTGTTLPVDGGAHLA